MPERLSQIDLISQLSNLIERRYGIPSVNQRQVNTIIKAATMIVNELEKPHVMATPGMGLAAWLRSDDTGLSSLWMVRYLAPSAGRHAPNVDYTYPHDPDDFGRCVRLLEAVPEFREHMSKMKESGAVWSRLIDAWNELEALYREELPSGSAPKLYERMRTLITEGERDAQDAT